MRETEVWAFTAWGFISVAARQMPQKLGRVGDRRQSLVTTSKNPLFHNYFRMIQPLLLTAGEFGCRALFGECNWLHEGSWCSKAHEWFCLFGSLPLNVLDLVMKFKFSKNFKQRSFLVSLSKLQRQKFLKLKGTVWGDKNSLNLYARQNTLVAFFSSKNIGKT